MVGQRSKKRPREPAIAQRVKTSLDIVSAEKGLSRKPNGACTLTERGPCVTDNREKSTPRSRAAKHTGLHLGNARIAAQFGRDVE